MGTPPQIVEAASARSELRGIRGESSPKPIQPSPSSHLPVHDCNRLDIKAQATKTETVCFVAGRSGGHLVPCLTHAYQLREKNPQTKIMLFSTDAALDQKIVRDYPWVDRYIPLRLDNIPYRKFWLWPLFGFQLINSFFVSFMELRKTRPTKVISMGGFTTIPVCLAARIMDIPIELFELNVVPGRAIKFLTPCAQKIWLVFEQSMQYFTGKPAAVVPYPIRFSESAGMLPTAQARKNLDLLPTKKTVLILGGSQGSVFINTLLKAWIEHLSIEQRAHIQIIHQTGHHDTTNWYKFYREHAIPAVIFDFNTAIEQCYAAADIVLCRSGAGTLFEVLFFGKRCITIPLETNTTAHQRENGFAMMHKYPALFTVVEQKVVEEKPEVLFKILDEGLSLQ